jgi:hypothetical protein
LLGGGEELVSCKGDECILRNNHNEINKAPWRRKGETNDDRERERERGQNQNSSKKRFKKSTSRAGVHFSLVSLDLYPRGPREGVALLDGTGATWELLIHSLITLLKHLYLGVSRLNSRESALWDLRARLTGLEWPRLFSGIQTGEMAARDWRGTN